MTESIARVVLGLLFLGTILFALWQHGRSMPSHKYHAAPTIAAVLVETWLIFLMGGWG